MIKRMCPECKSEDLREIEICYYYHYINSWGENNKPDDGELDHMIDESSDFDGLYCVDCLHEFPYGALVVEKRHDS